jgi:hypothetical protein
MQMEWKSMLSDKKRNLIFITILIVIPLVLMLPSMGDFHYPPEGGFSDLVITHYPNMVFLQKTLSNLHTIPLWNPSIFSGYPFDADPLSGLWYPFGWLALLFQLPFGLNLTMTLHIIWGGIGMYILMRANEVDDFAAFFSGLAWVLLPKIFGHFDAGHVTLIYAVAWTPWLFLSQKAISSGKQVWFRYLTPGLIMGLIILADIRWVVFAGLGWLVYVILLSEDGSEGEETDPEGKARKQIRTLRMIWKKVILVFRQIIVALLIGSPLLIPMALYLFQSSRISMQASDALNFSLPISRLLGFIFPDYHGNAEWIFYPGVCGVILAVCSLFRPRKKREEMTWGILFAGSLIWALGSNIPGLERIAGLPGFNLIRVPARALFMADFSIIVAAGLFLNDLIQHPDYAADFPKSKFWCNLMLAGVLVFTLAIGIITGIVSGTLKLETVVGMAGILVISILVFLRINRQLNLKIVLPVLLLVCALDLGINDIHFIQPRSVAEVLQEQSGVVNYLDDNKGAYRVYSPSYSLPQQTAANYEIETVNGVHPLQLAGYIEYMKAATGVPESGYSVTIPPFDGTDLAHVNQSSMPNGELLGLLNVRYVLSEFNINSEDFALKARIGDTRIYQNLKAMPRVWLELDGQILQGSKYVRILPSNNPNQVDVVVNGRGTVVLSEVNYPGWIAEMDGRRVDINTSYQILRSVDVPKGEHIIHFIYRPTGTMIGIFLSLITIIGVLINERITRFSMDRIA